MGFQLTSSATTFAARPVQTLKPRHSEAELFLAVTIFHALAVRPRNLLRCTRGKECTTSNEAILGLPHVQQVTPALHLHDQRSPQPGANFISLLVRIRPRASGAEPCRKNARRPLSFRPSLAGANATKSEWRNPENASQTIPCQGILSIPA